MSRYMRLFPSEQGLVNFFYKESDGKYFRLLRSYSLGYSYPSATATHKQPQWMDVLCSKTTKTGGV